MTVTLLEAAVAFNERKRVLFGDTLGGQADEDAVRRLSVGFDLDFTELWAMARRHAFVGLSGVGLGIGDPVQACTGLWMDGLLTGMMLAELRARATAEESA
jgi:hypothetical protein